MGRDSRETRGSRLKPNRGRFIYKERKATATTIFIRVAAVVGIVLFISFTVYFRDNYASEDQYFDSNDGQRSNLTISDSVYFTVISMTTTGYGDITPVSKEARVFDTFVISIGRAAIWFIIVGTAYQFVFDRYREAVMMKSKQQRLKGHSIICGYGLTGRTAAMELLAMGESKGNIVVISDSEIDSTRAAEEGFVSILGDPSKEEVLKSAVIEKASFLIVTIPRDDTNILITLTAKDLNPGIKVITQVMDLENRKLLRKSGVDVIIAPFVTGGNLMATATTQPNVVHLLEDVMTAKSGIYMREREITDSEAGKSPRDLKGVVILGVVRKGEIKTMADIDTLELIKGDRILFLDKGG
ncbi:MAG: potassium channel family protein [Thermoplasmatota archaeon]